MYLFIPSFVVSLIAHTDEDSTITFVQTSTKSGVTMLAIHGQFDDVQKFVASQNWDPASFVADGDNASYLKDEASKSALLRQVIVITDAGGQSLSDAQASIQKSELAELKDEELNFGHFVAAMSNGVDVASWTESYQGKWAQYATQSRFDLYIDPESRTIRNSVSMRTVLFIGDEGDRTLVGQLSLNEKSFKVISSDFAHNTQVRHDTTVDYLIETGLESKTINAVSAQNLAKYVEGEIDDLAWAQTSILNSIEEISTGIAGQNVVLLTLKGSEYRYVPATIAIEDGKLAVIPSTQYGVKVADFGTDTVGSPIVRASQDGLVMVDRNGGNDVINFTGPKAMDNKSYGPAMKRMIDAATAGLSAT